MKTTLFLLFTLAGALAAEELLPQLAPLAQKFDADGEALAQQRTAAWQPLKKPYLAVLDGAEKEARALLKTRIVEAVIRERDLLAKDLLPPIGPWDLPSPVQTARRSLLEAMGRVGTDFAGRQARLGTAYLGRLAAFPTGGNPTLAAQVAEEKERIKAAQLAANNVLGLTRNTVANGDFSVKGGENGVPAVWKLVAGNVEIVTEGGNSFVRLDGFLEQEINIPSHAREATFSIRARGFKPGRPQFYVTYQTQDATWVTCQGPPLEPIGEKWTAFTRTVKSGRNVGSVTVRLEMRDGIIDFDDVVFEMK